MSPIKELHNEISDNWSEKPGDIMQLEDQKMPRHSHLSPEDQAWLDSFPDDRKKAVVRKIDVRLVPLLAILYLFSFIDRANIGNAKIEGLEDDLKITPSQYNIALSVFFVPYVVLEVPSNYLLTKFKRPSVYIGGIIVAWGIVMALMGIVQNFSGLVASRFMLGVAEAGFFPGAVYIISQWYMPNEVQTRIAIFYSASALAGALSGLLAFGITRMDGVGNLEGWRWIFLLEGIATVIAGVICFFCLIDNAESSTWLDAEEKRFLSLRRIAVMGDQTAKHAETMSKRAKWSVLKSVLCDWQVYLQSIIYISATMPNYGLKFTMPQIIKNMGYTSANAQLLTIPPYCVGAISAFLSAVFADRLKWRMPFIVGAQTIVLIAFSILFSKAADIRDNIGLCYFGVVLACVGLYPITPGANAWTVNNLAGRTKAAMGIAYMIAIGNSGGIPGSYIYIQSEAPEYPTGFGVSLAAAGAGILSAVTLEVTYRSINKRRSRMSAEEVYGKYSVEELEAMGDRSPLFRYTL
ncbi:MFS domain-containing protein [Fusarium sp. Ph1]|nr:MFS domain-containing protein [Fusarium sp. Ph1]